QRLDCNSLHDVFVHVMPKFVREDGFDFIGRVVVEQRVGKNNASRVAESGQRSVRFLAFFGKLPLVNAADASSRAFTQADQTCLEFFVPQRLELVKNWKQQNRG